MRNLIKQLHSDIDACDTGDNSDKINEAHNTLDDILEKIDDIEAANNNIVEEAKTISKMVY